MNWTGGRLQRHSKANANAVVKTQRQHFAKTRLQSQGGSLPLSPAFSILGELRGESNPAHLRVSPQRRLQEREQELLSGRRWNRPPIVHRTPRPVKPCTIRPSAGQFNPDRNADHVEHAREDLLSMPDWVGLAVTRPKGGKINPREEMERSRPRRNVKLPKQRWHANPTKAHGQKADRSMKVLQPLSPLRTEDMSFRVGSNIHQTQTTPSIVPCKAQRDVSMTDWTKMGGQASLEARAQNRDSMPHIEVNSSPGRAAIDDARHETQATGASLIPLEEAIALNLSSFDQVLNHSVKLRSHAEKSIESLISGKPTSTLSASTFRDQLRRGSPCIMSETRLEEDSLSPQSVPRHGSYQSCSSGVEENPASGKSTISALTPGAQEVGTGDNTLPRRPRFTIDDQMELEQSLKQRETSELRALGTSQHHLIETEALVAEFRRSERGSTSQQFQPGYASRFFFPHAQDPRSLPYVVTPDPGRSSSGGYCLQSLKQKNDSSPPSRLADQTFCGARHPASITRTLSSRSRPAREQGPSLAPQTQDRNRQKHRDRLTFHSTVGTTPGFSTSTDMDNEAWMKYVFPDNFRQIQEGFSFGLTQKWPTVATLNHDMGLSKHAISPFMQGSSSFQLRCHQSGPASDPSKTARTVQTAMNTTLPATSPSMGSCPTTDFLSWLSPMEGVVDERLANLSVYNNASKADPCADHPSDPATALEIWSGPACRSIIPSKRRVPATFETGSSNARENPGGSSSQTSLPQSAGQSSLWSLYSTRGSPSADLRYGHPPSHQEPFSTPASKMLPLGFHASRSGNPKGRYVGNHAQRNHGLRVNRRLEYANMSAPNAGLDFDQHCFPWNSEKRFSSDTHNPSRSVDTLSDVLIVPETRTFESPTADANASAAPSPGLSRPSLLEMDMATMHAHSPQNCAGTAPTLPSQIPLWT